MSREPVPAASQLVDTATTFDSRHLPGPSLWGCKTAERVGMRAAAQILLVEQGRADPLIGTTLARPEVQQLPLSDPAGQSLHAL